MYEEYMKRLMTAHTSPALLTVPLWNATIPYLEEIHSVRDPNAFEFCEYSPQSDGPERIEQEEEEALEEAVDEAELHRRFCAVREDSTVFLRVFIVIG